MNWDGIAFAQVVWLEEQEVLLDEGYRQKRALYKYDIRALNTS